MRLDIPGRQMVCCSQVLAGNAAPPSMSCSWPNIGGANDFVNVRSQQLCADSVPAARGGLSACGLGAQLAPSYRSRPRTSKKDQELLDKVVEKMGSKKMTPMTTPVGPIYRKPIGAVLRPGGGFSQVRSEIVEAGSLFRRACCVGLGQLPALHSDSAGRPRRGRLAFWPCSLSAALISISIEFAFRGRCRQPAAPTARRNPASRVLIGILSA